MNKNFWKLVKLIKPGLIISLALCSYLVKAQNSNYVVYFTDKDNSPYSIDQPGDFLSSRAISRRNRQQISITEEDLPVNPSYVQGIMANGNVSVRQTTKWLNGALIQATSTDAEALKLLSYVSDVEFIAPGNVGGRMAKELEINGLKSFASDTLFQFDILGIPEMRADGYQGENMLIAVMDGGFDGMPNVKAFSNLFSENRVLMAYDFISRSSDVYQYSDHGTKVVSLMAAEQTSPDYAGVIPKASFLLYVTEDINFEYRIEEYRWLIATEKADSAGTDVVTSSLNYNIFDDPNMNYVNSQLDGQTSVITRAAQKAANKGILVVTSGGNTGLTDPWENVLFPGDIIDGLAVGSITSIFTPSVFSPRGPTADGRIKPDVMGYGSGTYVINRIGNIVTSSGTSFTAPQIAGLASGIWQAYPDISVGNLIDAVLFSSSNGTSPDNEIGYGVPSYRALSNYLEAETSEKWFAIYPNPISENDYLRIKVFDPVENNIVNFKMFDTLGKPLAEDKLSISWQDQEYFLEVASLPRGIYILNLQSTNNFSQVKILKL